MWVRICKCTVYFMWAPFIFFQSHKDLLPIRNVCIDNGDGDTSNAVKKYRLYMWFSHIPFFRIVCTYRNWMYFFLLGMVLMFFYGSLRFITPNLVKFIFAKIMDFHTHLYVFVVVDGIVFSVVFSCCFLVCRRRIANSPICWVRCV